MTGATLIELMVSLAILGLVAGISVLAVSALPRGGTDETLRLRDARARAVVEGVSVAYPRADSNAYVPPILFLPDGRAVGAGVDPLTGWIVQ